MAKAEPMYQVHLKKHKRCFQRLMRAKEVVYSTSKIKEKLINKNNNLR